MWIDSGESLKLNDIGYPDWRVNSMELLLILAAWPGGVEMFAYGFIFTLVCIFAGSMAEKINANPLPPDKQA